MQHWNKAVRDIYGGREGSAAKAAAYNAAYAATYHNQVVTTLRYGGRQCRIVAAASVE